MEKAQRCDKVVVWGCFHGKGGKDFSRYFIDIVKASDYYNKQLNKAAMMYLIKTTK